MILIRIKDDKVYEIKTGEEEYHDFLNHPLTVTEIPVDKFLVKEGEKVNVRSPYEIFELNHDYFFISDGQKEAILYSKDSSILKICCLNVLRSVSGFLSSLYSVLSVSNRYEIMMLFKGFVNYISLLFIYVLSAYCLLFVIFKQNIAKAPSLPVDDVRLIISKYYIYSTFSKMLNEAKPESFSQLDKVKEIKNDIVKYPVDAELKEVVIEAKQLVDNVSDNKSKFKSILKSDKKSNLKNSHKNCSIPTSIDADVMRFLPPKERARLKNKACE